MVSEQLISIVVPIHNSERYLGRCVESLVSQTHKLIEIILVDDGSTDSSSDVCDYWAAHDNRVRVVRQENAGVSQARNTGIKLSRGNYIGFVDSDDWVEPHMFEFLLNMLLSVGADVSCSSYFVTDGSRSRPRPVRTESFIASEEDALQCLCAPELGVMVWNKLFKRSVLQARQFKTMPESQSEDFEFLFRIYADGARIHYSSVPLYHYRESPGSLMHSGAISMSGIDVAREVRDYLRARRPDVSAYGEAIYAAYLLDAMVEIFSAGRQREFDEFLRSCRLVIRSSPIPETLRRPTVRTLIPVLKRMARRHLLAYHPELTSLTFGQFGTRRHGRWRRPSVDVGRMVAGTRGGER